MLLSLLVSSQFLLSGPQPVCPLHPRFWVLEDGPKPCSLPGGWFIITGAIPVALAPVMT